MQLGSGLIATRGGGRMENFLLLLGVGFVILCLRTTGSDLLVSLDT